MKKIIGTLAITALIAVAMPTPSYAQYGGGGGGIIPPSVIRTGGRSGQFNRPPVVAAPVAQINTGSVLGEAGFRFDSHLTLGSRGEEVTELQKLLKAEGFFGVEPTGYFGTITQAAVMAYQAAHNIPTTGYVGNLTLAQLNSTVVSTTVESPEVASLKTRVVGLIQQAIQLLQAQLAAVAASGSR